MPTTSTLFDNTISSALPAGNTLGAPETYYCCNCGFGPQTLELCPACISCGHVGCNCCTTDDRNETANLMTTSTITAAETIASTGVRNIDGVPRDLLSLTSPGHDTIGAIVTPAFGTVAPAEGGSYVWCRVYDVSTLEMHPMSDRRD
ncbi:hypothetical protein AOQ84DRAFT_367546 [Glonium stellatum]|uniref:Uncharacterized protein n=1 Tax=Glonium stellatum TaxID=574774 RepID=A0A8E2ETK6_9PEZI|nr:hypothetical protein AOQ84DRAFT_367546 [Glonium stellatum]